MNTPKTIPSPTHVSTHGEAYLPTLDPEEQARFRLGHLVVRGGDDSGTNRCGAYAPEGFVRTNLAGQLSLLEFVPNGATGNPHQDLVVLQKPVGSAA